MDNRVGGFVLIIASILFSSASSPVKAQTCSCAGAKLVSSQSLSTVEEGNLLLGLTTNFNNIDKLYSGTDELVSRTTERSTFTTLLEANYGISDRLSLTGTLTYVSKVRTTGLQNTNTSQELSTAGIGDGLIMAKYNVVQQTLWKPYSLTLGLGGKLPLGSNSLRANGIPLNADMQPGTGSWDGIGWMYISYTIRSQNISLFNVNSVRVTSEAERFNNNDKYEFGDEINSTLGLSGPAFNRLSYNLKLKYRWAGEDLRNGTVMPSTGGEWLNLEPGVGYQLTDRISLQTSAELPLYRNVQGTQPSTTFILSGSIFFSLDKLKQGFNPGLPKRN